MGTSANGTSPRRPSPETLWSLLVSALLLAASFAQEPGRILPETKLDITLDPIGYLGRALAGWDPSGGFGRIQNQAAGYLFPMGPFFALGQALGLPPWVTQRLWIGALLVAGYWGANRLARGLGVATAPGRVVAGLAYTLSAASLGVVAFQSAGQLPYAMAPWVLVPLVGATASSGPRRTAARSALAIAAMGGVNGASTLAVLPLALVWFTTRTPGRDRRRLLAWWVAGATAATVWWVIALAVSVRYGLRFTAFTEQSTITTSTESATEIWRGTGNWLAQLDTSAGRWLPGAWSMASSPVAVVASLALAAGGAIGIARREAPGRAWLLPSALLGAAVVGIGYEGAAASGLGPSIQALLDGPLVVFRNVHKFSAVVRLPLAIGLGHLVSTLGAPATAHRRWVPVAGAGGAIALVLLAGFPLVTGSLTAPGAFTEVPAAWRDAATWVDAREGSTRSLLLPGAAFAENRWGRPLDEPWGVLVDGSWAVRDLIPLGGNGSTRLLDGIDASLTAGTIGPGFLAALQRAGIGYLVVRNDLDPARSDGAAPATVRRLLSGVDGLERVRGFGPHLTPEEATGDRRVSADAGDLARTDLRQIELYRIRTPARRAVTYPATGSLVVGGAAEALVELPPWLTDGRAIFVDHDVPTGADGRVLTDRVVVATDSARRRDVDFGSVRDNATYTLTGDEASPFTDDQPRDRWVGDTEADQTVARLEGARRITAYGGHGDDGPARQPSAAFDGDATTAWSPSDPAVGRWIQLDLGEPRTVGDVTVTIPEAHGQRIRSVSVITDGGSRRGTIGPDGQVTVQPAPGKTSSVRVRIDEIVAGQALAPLGISEISFAPSATGHVAVARPLQAVSDGPAAVVSLQRSRQDPFRLGTSDEDAGLDRIADLRAAGDWTFTGTARALSGPALDARVAQATAPRTDDDLEVSGTAPWRGLPTFAPARAADGDPATAWVSTPTLTSPTLTLRWEGPVRVDDLTVVALRGGTEPVSEVQVIAGNRRTTRPLPASGRITIPPVTTDHLTLVIDPGHAATIPVGVAEVTIDGLEGRTTPAVDTAAVVDLGCGSGPALAVDGRPVPTTARTTVGSLLGLEPIPWRSCDPLRLATRDHRIDARPDPATDLLRTDTLLGQSPHLVGDPPDEPERRTRITSWGSEHRTLSIAPGAAVVLATSENENPGWHATLHGRELTPVRVDGWRQGYLVPAGRGGTVTLTFAPATAHHGGLALGAIGLLVLVLAATIAPGRRGAGTAPGVPPWVPPGERTWSDRLLIAVGVAVGLALGGPAVLALAVLLLIPDRARWLPAIIVACLTGAGAVVLTGSWDVGAVDQGSFSATAQVLSTVAWLALAASAVSPSWPARRRPGDTARAATPAAEVAAGSTPSSRGRSGRRWRRSGSTPGGTG